MKILNTHSSQLDSFRNITHWPHDSLSKKKGHSEFKFLLEEILSEESEGGDEYQILLPRHGRFWDNGYEDIG